MLRHCPITRFSSSGARKKMPNAACGKETLHIPLESQPLDLADPKDVAKEQLPPQKLLKIFSINIIAQGLPFCRRRVSIVCSRQVIYYNFGLATEPKNVKGHPTLSPPFTKVVLCNCWFIYDLFKFYSYKLHFEIEATWLVLFLFYFSAQWNIHLY